jgi:hypothetical protein
MAGSYDGPVTAARTRFKGEALLLSLWTTADSDPRADVCVSDGIFGICQTLSCFASLVNSCLGTRSFEGRASEGGATRFLN